MQEINAGYAKAMAFRLTFVGELGWELFVPTEYVSALYDEVLAAGRDLGARPAGFHALESLRCEIGYRHWGDDVTPGDTPLEAGLGFAVAFNKEVDFIGRAALEEQRAKGIGRRLIQFKLKDPEHLLVHSEPIFHQGQLVGRTTSGAYGHAVGASVALGYVERPMDEVKEMIATGGFEIEIAGDLQAADGSLRNFYDPLHERSKQ